MADPNQGTAYNNKTIDNLGKDIASACPGNTLFNITVTFKNPDTGYTFEPRSINSLILTQDFRHSYADSLRINFQISGKDHVNFYNNNSGMKADLVLTYVDKRNEPVSTEQPITRQYYVVLDNPICMAMAQPNMSEREPETANITCTLLEAPLYDLRHVGINGIFRNTSIHDALAFACNAFKIPKLAILDNIDNSFSYPHLIFPAYIKLDVLAAFLQNTYGVSELGCCAYYSTGCLYIYSPFNQAPAYPKSLHIVSATVGSYAGSEGVYSKQGTTLSFISTALPRFTDLSLVGKEDIASSLSYTRQTAVMEDPFQAPISMSPDDTDPKIPYEENLSYVIRLKDDKLAQNGANTDYFGITDNWCKVAEKLSGYMAITGNVNWARSRPFEITPDMAVTYFYCNLNNQVKSRTGRVNQAVTIIERVANVTAAKGQSVFRAATTMELRLSTTES